MIQRAIEYYQIPDYVIEEAKKLWTESEFELSRPLPTDDDVKAGITRLENENNKMKRDHEELINSILEAINNNSL